MVFRGVRVFSLHYVAPFHGVLLQNGNETGQRIVNRDAIRNMHTRERKRKREIVLINKTHIRHNDTTATTITSSSTKNYYTNTSHL